MPQTSIAYNPKGVQITFEEESHTYETDLVNNFTSSSGIIHEFFPQFDPVEVSNRIAAKKGTTPEALRQEWEDNKNTACTYGTRVHEVAEYHFTGKPHLNHQPQNEKEFKTFQVAQQAVNMLKSQFQLIGCELIVFSERFRIAGTMDLLMWDPATQSVLILDWKTNKEIKQSAYQNETGYAPLQHIQNCNYEHYALQLGVYQFLMEQEGYYPPGTKYRRALIHITPDGPQWYELQDRQKEVAQMILYHRIRPLEEYDYVPF